MPIKKKDGWKEALEGYVKEGKTYAQAQAALQEEFGEEEGKVGASTFGKLRKLAFPEEKRQEAIEDVGERHEKTDKKKKILKPANIWNAQKQKAGDTSQLADVLNQAIFFAVPCKSGKLELKHVQEINVGGGVVNTIAYLFPGLDFVNNPVVTLILRVALLVMKIRKICDGIRDRGAQRQNEVIGAPADGSNPDYQPGEERIIPLADFVSVHPTDAYMKKEGLMEADKEI